MPHERKSHQSAYSFENYLNLYVQPPPLYLSEYAIVSLLLRLWYNAEHKLDQVDSILEAEGAKTKLISNSVLSVRVSVNHDNDQLKLCTI
jgi:hypothetical protein